MRTLTRKTRFTVHKHRVWLAPAYLLWDGFLANAFAPRLPRQNASSHKESNASQNGLVKNYAFALFTLGLYLYLYDDSGW